MSDLCNRNTTSHPLSEADGQDADSQPAGGTSRRGFLTSSAVLAGVGAAPSLLPRSSFAQGAGPDDAALSALQQGPGRILLRGGIVLTLDPRIGDFAQADVLIEDGRIREVRPNLPVG